MDLYFNRNPTFTSHLAAHGLLDEPFVVVDVGVLGGANPRWDALGDYLVVHGFDAAREAIAELERRPAKGRSYHCCAVGERDGEAEFFYNLDNPSASSFFPTRENRFAAGSPRFEARRVPIRSLDSLVAAGEIPAPDFLKVDVEGFEAAVFRGAARCIATRLLGLEFETSFGVGPDYPHTHLGTLQEMIVPEGFRLFDLAFGRNARASYLKGRASHGLPLPADSVLGQPGAFNVVYCQDMIAQADLGQVHVRSRARESLDQILKQVVIFELYGLVDVAFDTVTRFAEDIAARIDPELAQRLLLASSLDYPGTRDTMAAEVATLRQEYSGLPHEIARLQRRIHELRQSSSWRMTAPFRAAKRLMTTGDWRDKPSIADVPTVDHDAPHGKE